MSGPKMSFLATCRRLLRRSMYSSVLSLPSQYFRRDGVGALGL